MSDVARPRPFARMRAKVRGERDASALAAMRRAGCLVYEELVVAERQVDSLLIAPMMPFDPGPATASHQVATWMGFVFQTAGEHLIDGQGSYRGYLPKPTYALAWRCLAAVRGWLVRAQQARMIPGYDLRHEYALPLHLPPWFTTKPHPASHVSALLDAAQAIRLRAEYGVFAIERAEAPERVKWLHGLLAEAAATHDYVERLHGGAINPMLVRFMTGHLCKALNSWYLVGQLVAFPELVDRYLPMAAHNGLFRVPFAGTAGRPRVPTHQPPPAAADLDEIIDQLPALPFDVRKPPLTPPPGCADETMWHRAFMLFTDHATATERFCRCGRQLVCPYRVLALMSLATAFLCGPGEAWPDSLRALHRRVVTG